MTPDTLLFKTKDGHAFATQRERDQHSMRRWRKANPGKRKAQNDRYVAKHPEETRAKHRRAKSRWKARSPEQALLRSAMNNAAIKGHEFSITIDDIKIPECCPILGVRLTALGSTPRTFNPSIDRRDNGKGYVPGNVFIISWRANTWKGARTIDEVRSLLKYMDGSA